MKNLGILILLAGLALGSYSLAMDVSVDVPAKEYGYGVSTPAMKVANIDRMAQRQNFIVFSGILSVVGAILLGFGSMQPKQAQVPTPEPLSAEADTEVPRTAPVNPQSLSICPKCRHMGDGEDVECGRCGAELAT